MRTRKAGNCIGSGPGDAEPSSFGAASELAEWVRVAARPEELIGRFRRLGPRFGPGTKGVGSVGAGRGARDAGTAKRNVEPLPGSEATSVCSLISTLSKDRRCAGSEDVPMKPRCSSMSFLET